MVEVTLTRSWADVAHAYGAAIAPKLNVPLPAELHAGDSLDNARAVTAWFHEHVQYSDVDFGQAPIADANHDATVKRGTGNASEAGLLLAALLRAAGMKAEVVLVDRGPLHGSDRDVPSLMSFDHLLVRATIGGAETGIDPEDPALPVGQLRANDQGRSALAIGVAAFIETPRAAATANSIHETRTYQLADIGFGTLTETSTEAGVFDAAAPPLAAQHDGRR